ncbi:hypothetical protein [Pseudogulbenkiania sp. MAI-1]|uniref:hypothetical protein n=1 Tax=Pseudogulbenkiania sp. MAI-1 TaxID=990370 RepID=UPI00045E6BE5|nr:hypothetical protein [Pseudogulbenkiania sp. MAI-1]
MLDFFLRGSKRKADPLGNAAAAKEWVESLKQEYGSASHDKVSEGVAELNRDGSVLTADRLEAILTINRETAQFHYQLGVQYLMNARMPKVLEAQLREQILGYGKEFLEAYQHVLSLTFSGEDGRRIYAMLPLVLARMMHYYCECARWSFFQGASPGEVFWLNVNHVYRFAEEHGLESAPVFLFGEQDEGTTVQDQFLILQMLALLSGGNLTPRQLNFSYELLRLVSNRMVLVREFSQELSFVVVLDEGRPASRCQGTFGSGFYRYWSTAEVSEILHGWLAVLETGHMPTELARLAEPGVDAGLFRILCREWAAKPVRIQRAERIAVSDRKIEVVHRLATLHRLIRHPDEQKLQTVAALPQDSFHSASDLRIYGFVTSRRKDKTASVLPGRVAETPLAKEVFNKWEIENISQTGLGVSLEAGGNEWVGLGELLGYKEGEGSSWSVGIVRRIRRLQREKIFLGIETLTDRPVAAALRGMDGKAVDPRVMQEHVWQGGVIALFVPLTKGERSTNALILPVASYMLGKQYCMSARGKLFQIALGKVFEKGRDWYLVEIELVKALEGLPAVVP